MPELILFRVCHPASPLQMVARYPVPFFYLHGISQDLPFPVPSWKLLPLRFLPLPTNVLLNVLRPVPGVGGFVCVGGFLGITGQRTFHVVL